MLHRCGAVSCLPQGALLGRRGRSRGVVLDGYEEGCSVIFFSDFGSLDSLKIRCFLA